MRKDDIEFLRELLEEYKEELKALREENAGLRQSLAIQYGASFHKPYTPAIPTIQPRRIYADDGLDWVDLPDED